MHDIEPQLAAETISEPARVASGRIDADENFPMLKRDYIRWTRLVHEPPVQRRHLSVGDDQNRNLGQLFQVARGSFW